MRKQIISLLLIVASWSCVDHESLPSGGGDTGGGGGNKPSVESDTIVYRAQVWVDKADMNRYGGERVFKNKIQTLFRNSTRFFNESPNKFDYHFTFEPGEEMVVYDTGGDQSKYDEYKNKAFGDLDITKYDFVLFLALNSDKTGLSCGGGGKNGQSVVMAYIPRSIDIFNDAVYPAQGTYSNLAHEYGHVRGATDLYQYIISASSNRVSHQALVPPRCNMGTGYFEWSDYCSSLFNYTAKQKQLEKNLSKNVYPDEVLVRVMRNGEPANGVTLNFYGTRAGGHFGGPDVYDKPGNSPYFTRKIGTTGDLLIGDIHGFYHPQQGNPGVPPKSPVDEFPWSRWFCFLVEVVDGSEKVYRWLPDYDLITHKLLTGEKRYVFTIEL